MAAPTANSTNLSLPCTIGTSTSTNSNNPFTVYGYSNIANLTVGALCLPVRSISVASTLLVTDCVVIFTGNGTGSVAITLPSVTSMTAGQVIIIMNSNSAVTVNVNSGLATIQIGTSNGFIVSNGAWARFM